MHVIADPHSSPEPKRFVMKDRTPWPLVLEYAIQSIMKGIIALGLVWVVWLVYQYKANMQVRLTKADKGVKSWLQLTDSKIASYRCRRKCKRPSSGEELADVQRTN